MNLSAEVLRKTVREFIKGYQERHPAARKSLQVVANRTPASYTTIRQIMNDSLTSLSLKKTVEIIGSLGGPRRVDEVVKLINETQNGTRDHRFDHLSDLSFFETEIDRLFADTINAKIIWAAFGTGHITREDIIYRWGKEGEDRLEIFIAKGLLVEEQGIVKGVNDNAGVSLKTTYKQLGLAYEMYDLAHSVDQENWVSLQTNSVNMEFVKKFREELRVVFTKFCDESSLSENKGDLHMFFGMIMDRYIEKTDNRILQ